MKSVTPCTTAAAADDTLVIVGAGHGGSTLAALLRQHGFFGRIVLIGEEACPPYHRPPLSKHLLHGEIEEELYPENFYLDQKIDLRTGVAATAIDTTQRLVSLADGSEVTYDWLVLATGARARRLPGMDSPELSNVHYLRTLSDARALTEVLESGQRLVVIGAGWIGLEIASSLSASGIAVTVLGRDSRTLRRVASAQLADFLRKYHEERGTVFAMEKQVTGIDIEDGRAVAVVLDTGERVECDQLLVAIGSEPEMELARAAGIEVAGGILVDEGARTSSPRVLAIGDVTRRPLPGQQTRLGLESIPSAIEQARQAVSTVLCQERPTAEVPWFWSDQFDLKLQIAGIRPDHGTVVERVNPDDSRHRVIFHLVEGRLVCAETVNAPGEFMASKQFIRDGIEFDPVLLADTTIELAGAATTLPQTDTCPPAEPTMEEVTPQQELSVPAGIPGYARITFVTSDIASTTIDARVGETLMQSALAANVPNILAECGGLATCGTCHLYVQKPWSDFLPEPAYEEETLLEFIEGYRPNSRLGCQVVVEEVLDGMVAHTVARD